MNLVYQPNDKGCFAACCATLFGGTYEEWDCVGHHHNDWREKLREKTGFDYFEVGLSDNARISPTLGDVYILGVKLLFGGKHVVLARATKAKAGDPMEVDIFHDPIGKIQSDYVIESIIVLAKIFRMP